MYLKAPKPPKKEHSCADYCKSGGSVLEEILVGKFSCSVNYEACPVLGLYRENYHLKNKSNDHK